MSAFGEPGPPAPPHAAAGVEGPGGPAAEKLQSRTAASEEARARFRMRAGEGRVAWEEVAHTVEGDTSRPRALRVEGHFREPERFPWRFGAVLVACAAMAATVWTVSSPSGTTFAGVVLMLVLWAVAARLWFHSPEVPEHMRVLLWLDQELKLVRVRSAPDGDALEDGQTFGFEEVLEVLYARRMLRVPGERVAFEGAGVFLRMEDGGVWPVVAGALDVEAAFRVASACALRMGIGVKQVGAGWGQ